MKKLFLTLAAAAIAASSAMADEATFDFVGTGDAYGIKRILSNPTSADLFTQSNPFTITNDDGAVSLTFSWEGADAFGMDLFSTITGSGLYVGRYDENANIKIDIPGATISAVTLLLGNEYATVDLQGTVISHVYPNNSDTYAWEGSATDSFNITIGEDGDGDPQNNYYIKGVSVTYEKEGETPDPTPGPIVEDTTLFTCLFGANYNSKGVTSYTTEFTATNNGKSWTLNNFNNNNNGWTYVKCGRKGSESTGIITTDFAVPELVTSVVLEVGALTAANVTSIDLYTSSDQENWNKVNSVTPVKGSVTIEVPAPAPNLYYKIEVPCTSASANGPFQLNQIDYIGHAAEGGKVEAGLNFNEDSITITEGDSFTAPTLNNPNALTIEWSSSDDAVATVDSEGNVTIVGAGETIITATSEETDKFYKGSAYYTLTVKAPVTDDGALYTCLFGTNYNSAGVGSYTTNFTATNNGKSWKVENFNNNNNSWDFVKCGRNGYESTGIITTDFAIPELVTSVVLTIDAVTTAYAPTIFLYSSSDNTTWEEINSVSTTTGDVIINIATPAPNLYYKIEVPCYKGKSNGLLTLSKIEYFGHADESGKVEAGLSFAKTSYEIAEGSAFEAPVLENPNNLKITWNSSDKDVATVDSEGKVTILGAGETVIKATSEETDNFYQGTAAYTLSVLPAANNIAQMIEKAPAKGDKILVNTELTVVYVNELYVYVTDAEDNFTLLYGSNSYKVGDVLAAGWEAVNSLYSSLLEWGGTFPEVTATKEVDYPSMQSISMETVNRVGVLTDVTFAEATPSNKSNFNGTLADGSTVLFRNNFTIASVGAGKYNVFGAVSRYNDDLQFFPIEYQIAFPESFEVAVSNENVTVSQGVDQGVYTINVSGETNEDTVIVTFKVPAGWDGFVIQSDGDVNPDIMPFTFKANASQWVSIDEILANGFKKANQISFDADGEEHGARLMLYKGDNVDVANNIDVMVNVTKKVEDVDPVFPESFKIDLDVEGLTVNQYDYDGVWTIDITGESDKNKVTVTVQIPEGWDGFLTISDGDINPEEIMPFAMKATSPDEIEWVPVATILSSMPLQKGNQITFDVDGDEHFGRMMLYKGDMANTSDNIELSFKAKYTGTVGVETIEAVDADARYFNLQGVEVANPAEGIYVKIANGVATKVIIK